MPPASSSTITATHPGPNLRTPAFEGGEKRRPLQHPPWYGTQSRAGGGSVPVDYALRQ